MFNTLLAIAGSALLINNVFGANNYCQLSNTDVDVSVRFNLCLDNKYYQCYEKSNDHDSDDTVNTSTLNVGVSNSSNGNNNNNNYNNLFSINYYNLNNLLKKADCYHVSNNCRHNQRFFVLDCYSSNFSAGSVSIASNSSSNCIVTSTSNSNSNSNNNSTQLQCKLLFNLTKKDYIYAFIAVIVLILMLFCVCPICCVYYYCRYHNGSKMMEHNSMFNRYNKKNKNEKYEKENEKKNIKYATTRGGDTTNNSCDGDMVYDQNENTENNALCGKKKMTFCMATTEQEIETQPIYNTNSNECNSHEKDGTNTRDEIVV